jgi:hypothetical protein
MIFKKLLYFFILDTRTKFLIIEALIYLGFARILIIIPFNKVSNFLGEQMEETSENNNPENERILKNIKHSISIVSKYTLWKSTCMVRAIAGMKMLERRRIESTIYLGISRDENGKMIAHAWLRSGQFYITGAEEMARFNVVGKFAKNSNLGEMKEI